MEEDSVSCMERASATAQPSLASDASQESKRRIFPSPIPSVPFIVHDIQNHIITESGRKTIGWWLEKNIPLVLPHFPRRD